MLSIIEAKKNGKELSRSQINTWIQGIVQGSIPDYQSAAMLMAIRLNGMSAEETSLLTMAMLESGERLEFSGFEKILDKHSTGGVGDKVTLVLAPLLAACHVPVAMLSGRGLGFSGGTIDKFEAIEGVNCSLDQAKMQENLNAFGWTNSMPTKALVPADRILYALRDVTATVDSLPLITASIMSKKLAGGASDLCLDVKCGEAAFMPGFEEAKALFHSLKVNGEQCGLRVKGVISRMVEPLGLAVGNYLEVIESVQMLRTYSSSPLMDLVMDLGQIMIQMNTPGIESGEARSQMKEQIQSGGALNKFYAYLEACGAKDKALTKLDKAHFDQIGFETVVSERDGFVSGVSGRSIAEAARDLGAGRKKADDTLDPFAGILIDAPIGTLVKEGTPLARFSGQSNDPAIAEVIKHAFQIQDASGAAIEPEPLTICVLD